MNKKQSQKFIRDVYHSLIREDDEPIFFPDFVSLLCEQDLHKDDRKIKYLDNFLFSFEEKFGRVELVCYKKHNPNQSVSKLNLSNQSLDGLIDDQDEFYLLYFIDKNIYILFSTWGSYMDQYIYWTREFVSAQQVIPTEIKITKYVGV